MKIVVLLVVVVFAVAVVAQSFGPAKQEMVDTERAFARMSVEQGIRPAFIAFIADDGILFRPKAVKGKQWMLDHPLPASDKKPLLKWRPSFADVSDSGNIGYTFGPWEYKDDVKDAEPSGYGHFVTIWKKQSDGTWKFAVDLGVSHPKWPDAELPARLPGILSGVGGLTSKPKPDINALRASFIKLEREFSESSEHLGGRQAFLAYAAPGIRVFREGKTPLEGRNSAALAISESKGVWSWQPEGWDVSTSNDLGYSYGTYQLKDNGKVTETGNYFRIWKQVVEITKGKHWKVVVDLANPVPTK